MDNYKIKVKDEAESKEAQELFFELGYSWPGCVKYYNNIGSYTFIAAYPDEMLLRWRGDTDKELTLPQLRDLVVLKRNDVKDATHTCENDFKYICIDGRWHLMTTDGWFHVSVNPNALKPIQTAQAVLNDLDELREEYKDYHQSPALISGAEALRALADGKEVEGFSEENEEWIPIVYFSVQDVVNGLYKFRLKPQTIKLELELPKPFEPKVGDIYWFLSPFYSTGYDHCTFANDSSDKLHVQYGAYRSEDDVKKAVEQLRKIRGTNS